MKKLGQEKTAGLFHAKEPVHINTPGAFLNARCIVAGLKGLSDAPLSQYLSYLGEQVEAASPLPVPPDWARDGRAMDWCTTNHVIRCDDLRQPFRHLLIPLLDKTF